MIREKLNAMNATIELYIRRSTMKMKNIFFLDEEEFLKFIT